MAVTNTTPEISYVKTGAVGTVHPIPFKLLQDSDLELYVDGVVSADGFTVTGAGTDSVSVVTTLDYTNGTVVTFKREVEYKQETQFSEGERYPGKRIENEFDNLAMQTQQLNAELARTPKAIPGDTPPSGSYKQAANTSTGQDADGNIVHRSPSETREFVGITGEVDAAAASAAAALVSENNAATSEDNAATSAGAASSSAASAAVSAAAASAIPESIYLFSSLNVIGYVSGDSFTVDGREIFVASSPVGGVPISDQLLFTSPPSATTLLDVLYRFFAGLTQITPQLSSGYAVLGDSNYVARKRGTAVVVTNAAEQVSVSDNASGFSWDEDVLGVIDNSLFLTTASQTLTQAQKDQLAANWPEAVADLTQAPVSAAQQAALDAKANTTVVEPLFESASHFYEYENLTPAAILRRANHAYICDEAGTAYLDLIGGLDLTVVGAANASVSGGRFGNYREFDGSTQWAESSVNVARDGGTFWFAVGANFDTITGEDGVFSEADSTTNRNVMLSRNGDQIQLRVRRAGNTNVDTFSVGPIAAGVDYVICGRCDHAGVYLYVDGVGESYGDAPFVTTSGVPDATNRKLFLGYSNVSGLASNSAMDGKIGFLAYGFGHISERAIDILSRCQQSDFESLKANLPRVIQRYKALMGVGDSLTTTQFADPAWTQRAVTAHDATWRAETSGIGGSSSVGIKNRFLAYPLANVERKVVAFWMGNNNASNRQTVIDDVEQCVERALFAGAEKVLILGLPNRTVTNATAGTIETQQGHIDFVNAGFAALAAARANVDYLDVQDHFVNPANYTPLDADDIADQTAGIVPRSARDDPSNAASTHLGAVGSQHLADLVATYLPL